MIMSGFEIPTEDLIEGRIEIDPKKKVPHRLV